MNKLHQQLPEIQSIKHFAQSFPEFVSIEELGVIQTNDMIYPIDGIVIGSKDRSVPTLGLFGGVHGLERIGTQVVLSFLHTLGQRMTWDRDLQDLITKRRIVCLPIVNPWGMGTHHRCNPNGVDLMRNAPVEAANPTFLVGGHRISPKLPWYRGKKDSEMEKEGQIMIDFVKKEVLPAPVSVTVDFHSGFGTQDQLWFPWACKKDPFPFFEEFQRLRNLFDETYPHHVYKIEPQSKTYTTHGDLWDYCLLENQKHFSQNIFIPLTLELGSWIWVKKNPLQLLSIFGLFNPVKEHRFSRVMRRHTFFFDFLMRSLRSYEYWCYGEKFASRERPLSLPKKVKHDLQN